MEEKSTTTTTQVCNDVLVTQVSNVELLNLTQSPDIPPEPRQFSFHGCRYNDSQLQQVQKRAINYWIGPRYVEFRTLQARLNSYKNKWPEGKQPTPEVVSTAGFFFDGEFTTNFD
jgi:hypothetical protein